MIDLTNALDTSSTGFLVTMIILAATLTILILPTIISFQKAGRKITTRSQRVESTIRISERDGKKVLREEASYGTWTVGEIMTGHDSERLSAETLLKATTIMNETLSASQTSFKMALVATLFIDCLIGALGYFLKIFGVFNDTEQVLFYSVVITVPLFAISITLLILRARMYIEDYVTTISEFNLYSNSTLLFWKGNIERTGHFNRIVYFEVYELPAAVKPNEEIVEIDEDQLENPTPKTSMDRNEFDLSMAQAQSYNMSTQSMRSEDIEYYNYAMQQQQMHQQMQYLQYQHQQQYAAQQYQEQQSLNQKQ